MTEFARAGSQRWLQVAVERQPALLGTALERCGAIPRGAAVDWRSTLRKDGFCEYRDAAALRKADIFGLPHRRLKDFWPARGPVWDAIGVASDGRAIFVEAKAHIPEAASPACRASAVALPRIQASLAEAVRSALVFLYFVNDTEMDGPTTEAEWKGAVRLIHAALGLPASLTRHGVYEAFLDVGRLRASGDQLTAGGQDGR